MRPSHHLLDAAAKAEATCRIDETKIPSLEESFVIIETAHVNAGSS